MKETLSYQKRFEELKTSYNNLEISLFHYKLYLEQLQEEIKANGCRAVGFGILCGDKNYLCQSCQKIINEIEEFLK